MPMKDIINHLGDKRRQQLGEVVRFGIVGVTATLLQYLIYRLLLRLAFHWDVEAGTHTLSTVAMTIGYVVSFIYNFIASTRFTFRVKANARRGAGFLFSHVVNYSLQMLTLNLFLLLGISNHQFPAGQVFPEALAPRQVMAGAVVRNISVVEILCSVIDTIKVMKRASKKSRNTRREYLPSSTGAAGSLRGSMGCTDAPF